MEESKTHKLVRSAQINAKTIASNNQTVVHKRDKQASKSTYGVGAKVGRAVGLGVGALEGAKVGPGVGKLVGSGVG